MPYDKPDVTQAFGIVLRRYRTERGFTQTELADEAGAHINTISLLERGKTGPALDLVLNLAQALDVHPGELMSDTIQKIES
jgi:transcriptional regulator with XRE-family HTH domain